MDAFEARQWIRFPPAAYAAVFIVGGISAAGTVTDVHAAMLASLVSLTTALVFLLFLPTRYSRARSAAGAMVCAAAGAVRLFSLSPEPVLPGLAAPEESLVVGIIREPPGGTAGIMRAIVEADSVLSPGGVVRGPTGVSCMFRRARGDSTFPRFRYGMRVALRGRVVSPPTRRNPGEGDTGRWFRSNDLHLIMEVRGSGRVAVLEGFGGCPLLRGFVYPLRDWTLAVIDRTVGGEEGEFLKGLVVGVRSGLTPELRQAFTRAGVAHILAVSGSNVAVVAAAGFFLFRFLRFRRAARLAGVGILLLAYMLVTGAQPPVVRATVMMSVFLFRSVVQERSDPVNSLGAAAALMLLVDPGQLFDVGFQLSFCAVAAILLFGPRFEPVVRRLPHRGRTAPALRGIVRLCAVSCSAMIGTAPITAAVFGSLPLIGVASNLVVVPASGISVLLGLVSLAAEDLFPPLAEAYGAVNRIVLAATLAVIRWTGGPAFEPLDTVWFGGIHVVPYCAGVVFLFFPGTWAGRKALAVFLVSLNLLVWPGKKDAGPVAGIRVTFLSVGQGDAALVEVEGGTALLFDAGPSGPGFDAGRDILLPYLRRRGIRELEVLVLSHAHADHTGGTAPLVRAGLVRRIVAGPGVPAPRGSDVAVERPRAGTVIDAGPGVRLYVLSAGGSTVNDASIVVKVVYGGVSVLFPGDAGHEIEDRLVRRYGSFLRSTVLKVSHHGSSTATGTDFLTEVRPSFAVLSAGLLNSFDHPSPMVISRLMERGVFIHRTDTGGALVLASDGVTMTPLLWR